ncbi:MULTISPECIES: hypothetical protein [unclassified Microbacterium]|uniref:hypothetical protein n=1 Tax=unclassified Microbacterium TaxID=2609290 RepID=UPI002882E426|nr:MULTISPECIES: hypothetical protein [unclassified Microbacterium]
MAKTTFDRARDTLVASIRSASTPLVLASVLNDTYGLKVGSHTFMDTVGVEPLLAVVERVSDGHRYVKRLDPFSLSEAVGSSLIREDQIDSRLSQFTAQELFYIDYKCKMSPALSEGRGWRYLRLATRADFADRTIAHARG